MGQVVYLPRRAQAEDDWWIQCVPYVRFQWAMRRQLEQLCLPAPEASDDHKEDRP